MNVMQNLPPPMNPQTSHPAPTAAHTPRLGFLPWVLAAGLAVTLAAFWSERGQLFQEVASLRGEALALRTHDVFAKVQIATLSAPDAADAKSSAVVVWDAEKQRGVIQLANVPRAGAGQDYQLWVSDPRHPQPVSAGVVPVGEDGRARVSFTPARTVRSAEKFTVSLERTGGAAVAAGPVILRSK